MGLPLNVGGWGPREGVTAWAFGAAGLGAETGLTVAVVYGVLSFVASLPGIPVLLARSYAGLWSPRTGTAPEPADGSGRTAAPAGEPVISASGEDAEGGSYASAAGGEGIRGGDGRHGAYPPCAPFPDSPAVICLPCRGRSRRPPACRWPGEGRGRAVRNCPRAERRPGGPDRPPAPERPARCPRAAPRRCARAAVRARPRLPSATTQQCPQFPNRSFFHGLSSRTACAYQIGTDHDRH
ncbi:hypothetical protein MBT84_47065 [Streptomyces sp. MBT84]|nr:hypothetical protein [Streptomyces sp. MBT84]